MKPHPTPSPRPHSHIAPLRVAIAGGGLQGLELCWLAAAAGWETLLLDARATPLALPLAHRFLRADVTALAPSAEAALCTVDLLIPATENPHALAALTDWCRRHGLPMAFDPEAYAVTACKLRSRELFQRLGTPIPPPALADAHGAPFPLLAKPAQGSGSHGVRLLADHAALLAAFPLGTATPHWIFEAFCPGPSFSLEVCGTPGAYRTFAITDLFMDAAYDCKAVAAPTTLPAAAARQLAAEAVRQAEALQLHGLMDVEAVLEPDGALRVLEIDARFPSQTPMAVYLATGVNLAVQLAACFLPGLTDGNPQAIWQRRCRLEHVRSDGVCLYEGGEGMLPRFGPLERVPHFHGADEALVGFRGKGRRREWAATLVFSVADTAEHTDADGQPQEASPAKALERKRRHCLQALRRAYALRAHVPSAPAPLAPLAQPALKVPTPRHIAPRN